MNIAIIPVKQKSRGLSKKNFREYQGRPLWEHTWHAAREAKSIAFVVVTSDSDYFITTQIEKGNIQNRGLPLSHQNIGKTFFHRRPDYLGIDPVQVDEVVLDAFRSLRGLATANAVVVLQPTSPLRTSEHIDNAVELYERAKQWPDGAHRYPISVFGAKQIGYAYQRGKGGLYQAVGHVPEHRLGRQNTDYDEVIVENGALYVVDAKRLSETRSFRSTEMLPFFMSEEASLEVDTMADWKRLVAE